MHPEVNVAIELFYFGVCLAISSLFGVITLIIVLYWSSKQQKEIREIQSARNKTTNTAVSISGNGNTKKR